jgi:hypothetical protein
VRDTTISRCSQHTAAKSTAPAAPSTGYEHHNRVMCASSYVPKTQACASHTIEACSVCTMRYRCCSLLWSCSALEASCHDTPLEIQCCDCGHYAHSYAHGCNYQRWRKLMQSLDIVCTCRQARSTCTVQYSLHWHMLTIQQNTLSCHRVFVGMLAYLQGVNAA